MCAVAGVGALRAALKDQAALPPAPPSRVENLAPAARYAVAVKLSMCIRKTVKWGGLVVGIALAIVFVVTWRRWCMVHWQPTAAVVYCLEVSSGNFIYDHAAAWDSTLAGGPPYWNWNVRDEPNVFWWPWKLQTPSVLRLGLPLWIPSLAALTTSALAWRLDHIANRRAKTDACPKCSYDRAGLAPAAPCPECGAPARGA